MPSFKSINSSSLSRKKYDRDNFNTTPRKRLRGQNTSVWIRLIEHAEPYDTLNYRPIFKYSILQTVLLVFFLFKFVWNNIFCSKTWAVFYIFLNWFGLVFGVTVLKILRFWCFFVRLWEIAKGYGKLYSYSRYNLLGIAIMQSFKRHPSIHTSDTMQ